MSLDKSIAHGKEHRKPYRGSKAFDPSCRNHGGCPWCEENRKHKFRDKLIYDAAEELILSLPEVEAPAEGWQSVEQYISELIDKL